VFSSTAEAHGCTAELRWGDAAYGPTVNAPGMVARVQAAAQALGDRADFMRMEEPTMAAEDFSFMAGPPAAA
jgi:metal-dependent amidase/aminoacylase/carboxypeptidase family protein